MATVTRNPAYSQADIFWTNQHSQFPNHPSSYPPPPPPFPDFRKKRRKDKTCTCLLIIFLLVLLALFGVGLGTYKILQLQKDLDQMKEISDTPEVKPAFEKLVGTGNHQAEKKDARLAAHLTRKEDGDLPLLWEDTVGRAFTAGIQYKKRGLVVNQTGLHFLYSAIYFRGTVCVDKQLTHVVYKKPLRYPGEMKLMENVEYHYCSSNGIWGRHSYLGAVFNLSRSDIIYVNVSEVNLVSPEESKTFFGMYKL
uniref:Tumor necrosis factor ligand superfamily member 6 n=1 Tax=Leptobrachium leishanense TaxID=445787 RepID=A0A8C5RBF0_9ANUR